MAEPTKDEPVAGGIARLSHQIAEPVGTLAPPAWSAWLGRCLSAAVFILIVVLAVRASPWG